MARTGSWLAVGFTAGLGDVCLYTIMTPISYNKRFVPRCSTSEEMVCGRSTAANAICNTLTLFLYSDRLIVMLYAREGRA